ncbi:MAG: L-threonylcarbamoyladenylate synthase [Desulfurivibrionaceae bacterium]
MLYIHPENPQPRLIKQAAEALKKGGIICYPTDTVYGIGCDIYNQKAVKRVYQLKNRPKDKPFSFICSDLKHVSLYCNLSNTGYRVMKKALPGPYTFVLPAMKVVPRIMMSKQKTVGIRVPDNEICHQLVKELGNPILNTSALMDKEDRVTDAWEVEERFGNMVDLIIDGGSIPPSESTVISMIEDKIEVLREGDGDLDSLNIR